MLKVQALYQVDNPINRLLQAKQATVDSNKFLYANSYLVNSTYYSSLGLNFDLKKETCDFVKENYDISKFTLSLISHHTIKEA